MLQVEKERKTKLVPPCFTLSELTSAAYSQRMASQGFVGRIDPEGIPLPKGAMISSANIGQANPMLRIVFHVGRL